MTAEITILFQILKLANKTELENYYLKQFTLLSDYLLSLAIKFIKLFRQLSLSVKQITSYFEQ